MIDRKGAAQEDDLVALVRGGDPGAQAVYADWLEERGFAARAALLRGPASPMTALTSLVHWVLWVGMRPRAYFCIDNGAAILGIDSDADISPGTGAVITNRPQRTAFLPTQVVVPDEVAPHFSIVDVRIGHRSRLVGCGPVPCSLLTPTAVEAHRGKLQLEEVGTAQDLVFEVQNTSDAARRFYALVFGIESAPYGSMSSRGLAWAAARMREQASALEEMAARQRDVELRNALAPAGRISAAEMTGVHDAIVARVHQDERDP